MQKSGFNIQHAAAARVIKGEDAMKARLLSPDHEGQGMMFLVCDGHAGVHAANFVMDNFQRLLLSRLPLEVFEAVEKQDFDKAAPMIRKALCEAFVLTDNRWMEAMHMAGTTVTVALVMGRLLTLANVGDSEAVLDTGCSVLELTHSHRIHSNLQEQARLKKAGCQIAPYGFHLRGPAEENEQGVGPLRVWPSGLCVSRSIGDADAGPEVVPVPHLKQLLIPAGGCRLMLASDGLWDVFSKAGTGFSKAVRLVRDKAAQDAATELIRVASLDKRVIDDTSVVVVDVLPGRAGAFPDVVRALPAAAAPPPGGGLCACCRPEVADPDARDVAGPGHVEFLAEVDGLVEFPALRGKLSRNSAVVRQSRGGGQTRPSPRPSTSPSPDPTIKPADAAAAAAAAVSHFDDSAMDAVEQILPELAIEMQAQARRDVAWKAETK